MNAVSPGVPCCLPGGTSTTWVCAEGTRSFSPTLVSQTTWPWLGESVDQLLVAPQHSLFRLCHPIKLELWIPPPPGGTSTPWECAAGTGSLSTTLVSQTGMAVTGHVQGSASCCFATQPVQAVPPSDGFTVGCGWLLWRSLFFGVSNGHCELIDSNLQYVAFFKKCNRMQWPAI